MHSQQRRKFQEHYKGRGTRVEEQLMRRLWHEQWTRWGEPWKRESAGRWDREPRAGRTMGDRRQGHWTREGWGRKGTGESRGPEQDDTP